MSSNGFSTNSAIIESPSRIAVTALAIYSLSLVAVMIAPAISGLVGTEILRKIVAHGPASEQWRIMMDYNYMINQAFDRIFVVASCGAIALWSLMIVKTRALSMAIGIYGLLLGCGTVIAVALGLRMDAHGFGLVVFGEGRGLVIVGCLLVRAEGEVTNDVGSDQ